MKGPKRLFGAGTGLSGLALAAAVAWAQQQGGHTMPMPGGGPTQQGQMMQAPGPGAGARDGRAEHAEHGAPAGWKFSLPKGGDPVKGRAVFVKLECFSCHQVNGENFPAPDPGKVGPELSAMAALHPGEYFAESIVNSNAVIEKGRGYEGADGSSKMPSFNEDMTVQDLIDLVAYLTSLKPPPAAGAPAPPPAVWPVRGAIAGEGRPALLDFVRAAPYPERTFEGRSGAWSDGSVS